MVPKRANAHYYGVSTACAFTQYIEQNINPSKPSNDIFFQSVCLNANAFNANDHRIAVLVNDQLITSYDVVQRMKLCALLSGIDITAEIKNQLLNFIAIETSDKTEI